MIAIKGIYDGKAIKPLDNIPIKKPTKVIITFIDEIIQSEDEMIRDFTSHTNAFKFWEDEKEDIYQDYLTKKAPK
ncbi:MAG: hypothetical protein EPN82_08415 [Bacteroidetes bacterium]|nr:MAG: hypothetical protein EPN82_08415 [Bacteroidota bacterium]